MLPFSPRWLAKMGRTDEARQTLIRLHGGRKHAKIEVVEAEITEMLVQIQWGGSRRSFSAWAGHLPRAERENLKSSYRDLVANRPNLHRTLCGVLIQAMTQWTGVNVNNYFGPTIYNALGYGGHTTLVINGISGTWGLIVTFIFITFIVDRLGRRWPLIIGSALCAVW